MTVADPKCKRCKRHKIWIGIGPGAEPVCPIDCVKKCPKCLSPDIEPFVMTSYFGPISNCRDLMHCLPCGNVWQEGTP